MNDAFSPASLAKAPSPLALREHVAEMQKERPMRLTRLEPGTLKPYHDAAIGLGLVLTPNKDNPGGNIDSCELHCALVYPIASAVRFV